MSETTLNVRIQNRSDNEANWSSVDPVLLKGEIAISSDKGNLYKVGDGTSKWSELTYNSAVSADAANFANYSTQALTDDKGQQIDTTYVSGVNVEQLEDSSVRITVTKGDESSKVFSFADKDTTYEVMTGASNTTAGAAGLVPRPVAGDNRKFLSGAGTWESVEVGVIGEMTGATAESDGESGLVPAPGTGKQDMFLRGDGTWATPTNTTYSNMTGCTNLAAGKAGLVPAPEASSVTKFLSNKGSWEEVDLSEMEGASSIKNGKSGKVPAPSAGDQEKFLKADGTWAVPVNTTYGAANPEEAGLVRLYTGTGNNTNGTMTQEAITAQLNSKSDNNHDHDAGDIISGKLSSDVLPETGVNAGSYNSVTVDEYGRVTAGFNPTTLEGYGITDAANKTHYHAISDITDLQTTLNGKAESGHTHSASDLTSGTLAVERLATTGISADTYRSVTVDEYGRVTAGSNPTTLSEYGITDAASKTHGHAISEITDLQTTLDGKAASSHTHNSADINSLDASKLTGTISIDRLPKGALERCVVVANDTARFALTSDEVQLGDTVKVTETSKMYFVVDISKLSSNDGYEEYLVGTAAAVAWSGVTSKPTTLSGYGITDAADKYHNHAISDITDLQTALDGKSVTGHKHSAEDLTSGTLAAERLATSGVTAGTYRSITVDKYGRVTAGTNPTTLEGYGITDAAAKSHTHAISDVTDLQTTLDGKAASSHTHSAEDLTSGTLAAERLATSGVTVGTYKSVTVDKYGRVTAGSNPTTLSGYGITDAANKTHTHAISDVTDLQTALDGKSATGHTHNYLPLSGGTLTGAITIKSATSESNAYGSTNPKIDFSNSDGNQLISLIFTDYDSIANPASLTLIGNTGGEYFIAPNIKATADIYEAGTKLSEKYQAKGNYAGSSSNGGAATSAVKWSTARNINGMSINGEANRVNYGTCSTEAATAAKVVSCTGFALITGSEITVKFTVTNTASSPTLNVNGTGAKSIYYRGSAISAGYLAANRTYTFRYNGTQYELVGDINTDADTKATQTNTTTSADYRLVLSTNANDTTETNTLRKSTNFKANPSTGAFYAKGYNKNDITSQTLDINTLNLSAGTPHKMEYVEKTSGGANNITNIPVTGQPFILTVESVRWASTTDYITKQTFQSSSDKEMIYQRWCTNGTWSAWTAFCTMGVLDFGFEG